MRALTPQEKRTIRLASIGIVCYLVLFFGLSGFNKLRARKADYDSLVSRAERMKNEIEPYQTKALIVAKLMDSFQMDPMHLSRTTLVTQASSAIQKAATSGGIQLGPLRESPNRSSGKELSTIQLEANGPLPAILNFVGRFESLGFPLVIDTLQINSDPQRPGMIKLSLTIQILDFDKWKSTEVPHA